MWIADLRLDRKECLDALEEFAETRKALLGFVTPEPGPWFSTRLMGAINARERELLIGLVARLKLPTVYPFRFYPDRGGLASYGFDRTQQVREAASYVDRILRGTKPQDLPVQLPTKFQFVINLRTARALGLTVPPSLLLRADEVIQ